MLPDVGVFCVTHLYNIVDGIFVGQDVCAAALGSVNMAIPFITLAVAIATMIPMDGATIVAIVIYDLTAFTDLASSPVTLQSSKKSKALKSTPFFRQRLFI